MKKTPLDSRLSAYMDGEASREEKEELERLIVSDPEIRRTYERLRHGSDTGRRAFDEVLREPVPLALVRAIKSAQPPKVREMPRFIPPSLKLAPTGRQALAAALVLFFVGGGIGYFYATAPNGPPATTTQAPARNWIDDVVSAHRVYAHQPLHLTELPATEGPEISKWLAGSVGAKFTLPDLASVGLSFQGARLIVAAGIPAGQLIYKNADGDVIAVYFLKDNTADSTNDFNEIIRDDVGLVPWHRDGIGYAVVGPSADPTLDDIAARVSAAI